MQTYDLKVKEGREKRLGKRKDSKKRKKEKEMIKAKFHNGECYINAKGNTISLVAELMASPAMMANILFERLELPKETEKEIVKEIIKDLEEKFL